MALHLIILKFFLDTDIMPESFFIIHFLRFHDQSYNDIGFLQLDGKNQRNKIRSSKIKPLNENPTTTKISKEKNKRCGVGIGGGGSVLTNM